MFEKVVFHVDVNSAYLSWESVYRLKHRGGSLDLRQIPSAVAGDISMRHGIILAKSIPAKKYGVRTGEATWEAIQKCRDLQLVPPNYNLYESASKALMEILSEYSPDVEQYSIDEAFMDMTGTTGLFGTPLEAAERMRLRIKNELGFTVNIGISENKILAKMASDFRKPDMVHTLFLHEISRKMWPLPVSDLFFVGRQTAGKLLALGIRTIGELANTDPRLLRLHLKSHGEVIWAFANGIDMSAVQSQPPPGKGYGNSTTIPFDVEEEGTARLVLLALAETVAARLRKEKVKAEVIATGIKSFDLSYASHQRTLINPTNSTKEIHGIACELFTELWDGRPVRHLGIHTSRIRKGDGARQISFFDEENYERWEMLETAVDAVRLRFGNDSMMRAAFAKSPIDHMEGGISREKRTVDYRKLKIE